jgi:diguanylate cyclase (GGDEF)-like protein
MAPTECAAGSIACRDGVATIAADETLDRAAQRMQRLGVGSLLVTDDAGHLVGIITERDIVCGSTSTCTSPASIRVGEIMTTDVAHCGISTPVSEAHDIMVSRRVRHLPVIEGGKPVGMLSSRDVLAHQLRATRAMRAAAEEAAQLIKCLESLEFEKVLHVIRCEVPRIFQAEQWVLCSCDDAARVSGRCLSREGNCPAGEEGLLAMGQLARASQSAVLVKDMRRRACGTSNGHCPGALIPLGADIRTDESGEPPGPRRSFLCMCGLSAESDVSAEVLEYKVALLQDVLSATLANARLYEEARRRSHVDSLTGLKTRDVLTEKLREEHERARRYGRAFSVGVVDVDNFKSVNDTYGHAVGDQILCRLASLFRAKARATDVAARYGGDEFVLVLPETNLEEAVAIFERLRKCAAETLVLSDARAVTISIGAAEWSGETDRDGDQVLRRADFALYEAKRGGRNRVARQMLGAVE